MFKRGRCRTCFLSWKGRKHANGEHEAKLAMQRAAAIADGKEPQFPRVLGSRRLIAGLRKMLPFSVRRVAAEKRWEKQRDATNARFKAWNPQPVTG